MKRIVALFIFSAFFSFSVYSMNNHFRQKVVALSCPVCLCWMPFYEIKVFKCGHSCHKQCGNKLKKFIKKCCPLCPFNNQSGNVFRKYETAVALAILQNNEKYLGNLLSQAICTNFEVPFHFVKQAALGSDQKTFSTLINHISTYNNWNAYQFSIEETMVEVASCGNIDALQSIISSYQECVSNGRVIQAIQKAVDRQHIEVVKFLIKKYHDNNFILNKVADKVGLFALEKCQLDLLQMVQGPSRDPLVKKATEKNSVHNRSEDGKKWVWSLENLPEDLISKKNPLESEPENEKLSLLGWDEGLRKLRAQSSATHIHQT